MQTVLAGPGIKESAETTSRRKFIFNAGFRAGFKNRDKVVPDRWASSYFANDWLNGWSQGQHRRNQDL